MFRLRTVLALPFRSVGFTAVLLIGGILGLQYAGFWYALNAAEISSEEQLQRHMQNLGGVAGAVVSPLALPVAEMAADLERRYPDLARFPIQSADGPIVALAESIAHEDLTFALNDFIGRAGLREAAILDPEGRVLAVTPEARQLLQPWPPLEIDYDAFVLALDGTVASSLAYTVGDDPLKRVYAPLRRELAGPDETGPDETGPADEVAAVICLTAGGGFLAPLVRLPVHIRLINGVLTMLVLAMGILFYRMLVAQRGIERRAAHADRLSSLGALAAGFAHEIRNPLEIISACTGDMQKTLRERKFDADEAAETCADILEEVERMDQLVEGFLQYSRLEPATDPGDFAPAGPVAADACRFMGHAARRAGVRIETDAAEADPGVAVPMAAGPLRQVLINLLMNAVQVSPPDSTVRLSLRTDPRRVTVRVCDQGPGIAPAIRDRIFEPFFTTRDGGSGLGLAIAHQLVTRAGGGLTAPDRRGAPGACFEVSLPVARRGGAPGGESGSREEPVMEGAA